MSRFTILPSSRAFHEIGVTTSLMPLQISGLFDVFVHWSYQIRTIWIEGESEVRLKECQDRVFVRGFDTSTIYKVNISTRGQGTSDLPP